MRDETHCHHMHYTFRLAARVNTYHSLCYTSRGSLARTRNSSMGPPSRINPTTHHTMSERSRQGKKSWKYVSKKLTNGGVCVVCACVCVCVCVCVCDHKSNSVCVCVCVCIYIYIYIYIYRCVTICIVCMSDWTIHT